jgi:hypothetical protein
MAQDSFVFLPDISGFTEFVSQTEISHSRHVIAELLEVIIEADGLGMTVAEIEGDAVLFYLPGQVPSLRAVVEQARATFEAFHTHLKRYERDRICPCGACQTASSLTLKMIAHRGPMEIIEVHGFEKPYGPDVILAHRLLKNDVEDSEYILLTSGFPGDEEDVPDWARLIAGKSEYDSLGPVSYAHAPLGPLRPGIPDPPAPEPLPRSTRPITKEVLIRLPLDEAYQLVSDFGQRMRWTRGVDDIQFDPDRVNRIGTRHQCVIDGTVIEFETVSGDFGKERLVYGERLLGKAPVLDPTLYYILEQHPDGTRVSVEVHYRSKPFPRSLLAGPFRWVFSRQLGKSLSALGAAAGT